MAMIPMCVKPLTIHRCSSQLGAQEWLMKREAFPCTSGRSWV